MQSTRARHETTCDPAVESVHCYYLVDLIGIDHVGISSDFDGGGGIDGWNDASETFNVTLKLVRRGYTEAGDRASLERQPAACS